MRHFVLLGSLGVLSLAVAAFVGPRLYMGSPTRSAYCKILQCDELDSYDALCRAASIAEFGDYESVEHRLAQVQRELDEEVAGPEAVANLAKVLAAPRAERYPMLEGAARSSGAPTWSCPALKRVMTSTVP